jgi:hypothetical protein
LWRRWGFMYSYIEKTRTIDVRPLQIDVTPFQFVSFQHRTLVKMPYWPFTLLFAG